MSAFDSGGGGGRWGGSRRTGATRSARTATLEASRSRARCENRHSGDEDSRILSLGDRFASGGDSRRGTVCPLDVFSPYLWPSSDVIARRAWTRRPRSRSFSLQDLPMVAGALPSPSVSHWRHWRKGTRPTSSSPWKRQSLVPHRVVVAYTPGVSPNHWSPTSSTSNSSVAYSRCAPPATRSTVANCRSTSQVDPPCVSRRHCKAWARWPTGRTRCLS